MNGALHFGETRRWAIEAGFSEAEADAIARADIGVDRLHPGNRPANWGWHYRIAGANKRAARLLEDAIMSTDLVSLGQALHCKQDALTHNFLGPLGHWPGIDHWHARGPRVRTEIERASREMLGEYLAATTRGEQEHGL